MLQNKRKYKTNLDVNYLKRHKAGGNKKYDVTGNSMDIRTQAFCIR